MAHICESLCLLFSVLVCKSGCTIVTWKCQTVFIETGSIDNSILVISMVTKSLLACSITCVTASDCASIYFERDTTSCTRNNHLADLEGVTTYSTGGTGRIAYCPLAKTYGSACSSSADCVESNSACSGGVCACMAFYSYDMHTQNCAKGCTEYGTTFQDDLNHGISEHNDITYPDVPGYQACQNICSDTSDFICRSVEYSTTYQTCSLSTDTKWTAAPNSYQPTELFHLYHRNCV